LLCTQLQMLLNPDEVQVKSKIWFEENGDYLKEQEGMFVCSNTVLHCLEYQHKAHNPKNSTA